MENIKIDTEKVKKLREIANEKDRYISELNMLLIKALKGEIKKEEYGKIKQRISEIRIRLKNLGESIKNNKKIVE